MKASSIRVPASAATDNRISGRTFRVLCLICRHAGGKNWATVKQTMLAKELRCSRGTIQQSINSLQRAGYIEIRNRTKVSGRTVHHPFSAHTYHIRGGNE